jgi:hypothetical protein
MIENNFVFICELFKFYAVRTFTEVCISILAHLNIFVLSILQLFTRPLLFHAFDMRDRLTLLLFFNFPEVRGEVVRKIGPGKYEASIASSAQLLQDSKSVLKPVCENHANKDVADAVDIDIRNRPPSPETLELMCDEQDGMFFSNGSANGVAIDNTYLNMIQKSSNSDGCTDAYAEQERIILTKFRDVLGGLVTLGSIKG